jgi:hypothetical protein
MLFVMKRGINTQKSKGNGQSAWHSSGVFTRIFTESEFDRTVLGIFEEANIDKPVL